MLDESLPLDDRRLKMLPKMRKRCKAIIRECEQLIADYEYWQNMPHNREHANLIDIEDTRVTLLETKPQLDQIERIMTKVGLL